MVHVYYFIETDVVYCLGDMYVICCE